ncbi:MAG: hypothetical protein GY810_25645 [Aureispira sp.]|nr:hypothetical protein [Aureispira sp.]
MKHLLLLIYAGCCTVACQAQTKTMEIADWDFLQWKMSETEVEKALMEQKIDYTPLRPNSKSLSTKAKNFRGFERLSFDYDLGLYHIQLYKTSTDKQEAEEFVAAQIKKFNTLCGDAATEDNSTRKLRTSTWIKDKTAITLNFFYDSSDYKGNPQFEIQLFYAQP